MRGWVVAAALLALAGCAAVERVVERVREVPDPGRCLAELGEMPGVRFTALPPQQLGACRVEGAVRLIDIGVPVTGLGALSCPMARSLVTWTREVVEPAAAEHLGARVTAVESMGSFACRTRNNAAGAPLSEHALANAVDVGGFRLAGGRRVRVLSGWSGGDAGERAFWRAVHRGGCRVFDVGIGPDANAAHRDHLHFDMGGGRYCR